MKIGKSSSYDDFKLGQILYIRCEGLTVGEYGYKSGDFGGAGLLQLGMLGDGWKEYREGTRATVPEYETAYLDVQRIIDSHIIRGRILPEAERIKPLLNPAISSSFKTNTQDDLVGKLVRFSSIRYGNSKNGKQVFALFYPNANLNHTKNEPWNRVFISAPTTPADGVDYTHNITTWALTKERLIWHVSEGHWDTLEIGSGGDMYGDIASGVTPKDYFGYEIPYKDEILAHATAQSVSHYFMSGSTEIQVRSSGYARFADVEIPADVRSKARTLDVTGILTRYQGGVQFTLLNLPE